MPRTIRSLVRVSAPPRSAWQFGALSAPLFTLIFLGVGCISIKSSSTGADGGLYRSSDKGENWSHQTALPTSKGVDSIAGVDVATIAFDPGDQKAMYLGTGANGVLYSYDGSASWKRAEAVPNARIPAVAVSKRSKCTVFVAYANRVVRSTDCNRTYETVFTDSRSDVAVTALVIDWFDPRKIYAGTSKGDLLRSSDEGGTWSTVQRFNDAIKLIVMSSRDSRILFAGLERAGLQRTLDAGETWTELRKIFDPFDGAKNLFAFTEVKTDANTYVHASRYGLLRTSDNGDSWSKIETLTPPGTTAIFSLAVNPKNGREIYYATGNTLYRTLDGGNTWTPKKLPTARAGTALAVDPNDGNVIYLGGTTIKK